MVNEEEALKVWSLLPPGPLTISAARRIADKMGISVRVVQRYKTVADGFHGGRANDQISRSTWAISTIEELRILWNRNPVWRQKARNVTEFEYAEVVSGPTGNAVALSPTLDIRVSYTRNRPGSDFGQENGDLLELHVGLQASAPMEIESMRLRVGDQDLEQVNISPENDPDLGLDAIRDLPPNLDELHGGVRTEFALTPLFQVPQNPSRDEADTRLLVAADGRQWASQPILLPSEE